MYPVPSICDVLTDREGACSSVLNSDRRAVQAIGRIDRGADQNEGLNGTLARRKVVEKPEKEVMAEIQAIVRQITASVTFLPLLNDPCAPSPLLTAPSPCPRAPCLVPHPRPDVSSTSPPLDLALPLADERRICEELILHR